LGIFWESSGYSDSLEDVNSHHKSLKMLSTRRRRISLNSSHIGLCAGFWLWIGFVASIGLLDGQVLLKGQVIRGDVPITDGLVMLHSVSSMRAGQVDSVNLNKQGLFEFLLPDSSGEPVVGELYIASVEYQGVLYFGSAVTDEAQLEDLYTIPVFESKSVNAEGVALPLKVRNILLANNLNTWEVRDVIAVENPRSETLIPTGDDGIVWSYPLPDGFSEPRVVRGELPPEDVLFTENRVLVKAPIPPGERMLVILYQLPDLDVIFPAPGITETFEMFVKEPGPSLQVTDLDPLDVVSLEPGSTYRRYTGSNLVDANISVIEVNESDPYPLGRISLAVAILLISVVALSGMGYIGPSRPAEISPLEHKRFLLLKIAQLDQFREKGIDLEEDFNLQAERTELLAQLKDQG
jgi:hypothetical protein